MDLRLGERERLEDPLRAVADAGCERGAFEHLADVAVVAVRMRARGDFSVRVPGTVRVFVSVRVVVSAWVVVSVAVSVGRHLHDPAVVAVDQDAELRCPDAGADEVVVAQREAVHAEGGQPGLDHRERYAEVEQRADRHVARDAGEGVEPRDSQRAAPRWPERPPRRFEVARSASSTHSRIRRW